MKRSPTMGRPTSSTTRGDPPDNRCGAPLAYRLALVAGKVAADEYRLRGSVVLAPSTQDRKVPSMLPICTGVTSSTNSWQRCPPGPPRSARYGSGLRAGRAVLGTESLSLSRTMWAAVILFGDVSGRINDRRDSGIWR